jgi:type IV pilus assembly protein PilY1
MIDAGEFFAKPENLRKHPEIPVSADNPVVSCRANFNILMTDGQWNVKLGSDVMSGIARDEDDVNLPDGKSYSGSNALYASKFKASALGDSTDSPVTLADVAFHYWKTDLSDESDNVKKLMRNVSGLEADDYWDPLNDPATWQHMSNYIVSFGVTGTIDPSIESVKALESGELSWPPIQYDSEERSRDAVLSYTRPAKIDDLYHAAINSRGDYYGSQSSDELVAGLKRAVSSITDSIESNTQVVINTGTISSGTVIYQAVYDGPNGIGRLAAKPISDGSLAATEGAEGCNSRPVGSVCDVTRDAGWDTIDSIHPSTVNDFASTRQLFTSVLNEETSLRRLQAFRWSGLTASQQQRMLEAVKDSLSLGIDWSADDLDAELAGSVLGTQMLDYIRGQDVLEVDEVDGLFRNRHHARLGPVVNASPLYVSNGVKADGSQERYFPDDLEGEGSARYQDFLCSGARLASATPCATGSIYNRTPVVYVNSNDGMLHAFDASLYDDDGNPASGKELFAYLPDLLLEKVSASVLPSYSYEAMADGPLSSADVYYDASWHSVLIGGLRSGGKGYYALDVTQPEMYTEARVSEGANPVLWEFTHEELGYSYSQAVIVKSNYRSPSGSTGKWVAIFGNGYNSHSHQASLFIVDIETGALIKHISTGVGSADSENGMGTPAVIFNDSGYTADYAYVGDLLGNMWKFDLRSSNPDDWDLAYRSSSEEAATPFFTAAKLDDATDRMVPQPIMAAPLVAAHPSGREGNMLYFGTGKYLEASDHSAGGVVQTFYGLWDKDECRSAEGLKACAKQAASANMVRSAPSPLLQQTLTSESHAERGARVTTAHAIEWEGEHAKRGWYLDLPASSGERVISQPVVSGLNVYFATFIPGLNVCDGGGESWLMALNKTTGGTPTMQPFDHDNNGLIDGGDHHSGSKTSGIKLDAYSAGVGTIARCGSNLCVYASDKPQISEDGVFEGRWRWRQLQ